MSETKSKFKLVNAIALGLAVTAAATSVSANAAVACYGTVIKSWTSSDGQVVVDSSWRSDHTTLCNILTPWKGVPPSVCLSWQAKVDAAVSMGRAVTVYIIDAPAGTTCATLPTYGDAYAPYYVMLH